MSEISAGVRTVKKLFLFICLVGILSLKASAQSTARPYQFGFTIDEQQHRFEKRDERGIVMGEFGFITADGIYHVTVYATDEEGKFRILAFKNYPYKPIETSPRPVTTTTTAEPLPQPKDLVKQFYNSEACSGCILPNGKSSITRLRSGDSTKVDIRPLSKPLGLNANAATLFSQLFLNKNTQTKDTISPSTRSGIIPPIAFTKPIPVATEDGNPGFVIDSQILNTHSKAVLSVGKTLNMVTALMEKFLKGKVQKGPLSAADSILQENILNSNGTYDLLFIQNNKASPSNPNPHLSVQLNPVDELVKSLDPLLSASANLAKILKENPSILDRFSENSLDDDPANGGNRIDSAAKKTSSSSSKESSLNPVNSKNLNKATANKSSKDHLKINDGNLINESPRKLVQNPNLYPLTNPSAEPLDQESFIFDDIVSADSFHPRQSLLESKRIPSILKEQILKQPTGQTVYQTQIVSNAALEDTSPAGHLSKTPSLNKKASRNPSAQSVTSGRGSEKVTAGNKDSDFDLNTAGRSSSRVTSQAQTGKLDNANPQEDHDIIHSSSQQIIKAVPSLRSNSKDHIAASAPGNYQNDVFTPTSKQYGEDLQQLTNPGSNVLLNSGLPNSRRNNKPERNFAQVEVESSLGSKPGSAIHLHDKSSSHNKPISTQFNTQSPIALNLGASIRLSGNQASGISEKTRNTFNDASLPVSISGAPASVNKDGLSSYSPGSFQQASTNLDVQFPQGSKSSSSLQVGSNEPLSYSDGSSRQASDQHSSRNSLAGKAGSNILLNSNPHRSSIDGISKQSLKNLNSQSNIGSDPSLVSLLNSNSALGHRLPGSNILPNNNPHRSNTDGISEQSLKHLNSQSNIGSVPSLVSLLNSNSALGAPNSVNKDVLSSYSPGSFQQASTNLDLQLPQGSKSSSSLRVGSNGPLSYRDSSSKQASDQHSSRNSLGGKAGSNILPNNNPHRSNTDGVSEQSLKHLNSQSHTGSDPSLVSLLNSNSPPGSKLPSSQYPKPSPTDSNTGSSALLKTKSPSSNTGDSSKKPLSELRTHSLLGSNPKLDSQDSHSSSLNYQDNNFDRPLSQHNAQSLPDLDLESDTLLNGNEPFNYLAGSFKKSSTKFGEQLPSNPASESVLQNTPHINYANDLSKEPAAGGSLKTNPVLATLVNKNPTQNYKDSSSKGTLNAAPLVDAHSRSASLFNDKARLSYTDASSEQPSKQSSVQSSLLSKLISPSGNSKHPTSQFEAQSIGSLKPGSGLISENNSPLSSKGGTAKLRTSQSETLLDNKASTASADDSSELPSKQFNEASLLGSGSAPASLLNQKASSSSISGSAKLHSAPNSGQPPIASKPELTTLSDNNSRLRDPIGNPNKPSTQSISGLPGNFHLTPAHKSPEGAPGNSNAFKSGQASIRSPLKSALLTDGSSSVPKDGNSEAPISNLQASSSNSASSKTHPSPIHHTTQNKPHTTRQGAPDSAARGQSIGLNSGNSPQSDGNKVKGILPNVINAVVPLVSSSDNNQEGDFSKDLGSSGPSTIKGNAPSGGNADSKQNYPNQRQGNDEASSSGRNSNNPSLSSRSSTSAVGGTKSGVAGGPGDLYRFKYILDYNGHTETGSRNGNKEGSYFVIGDDNIQRTIEYIANEFGYQPHVSIKKLDPNASKPDENSLKDYEFVWFSKDKEQ